MINIIQDSILQSTSFMSNLQGSLVTDYFEKLRFYTEDDVKLFGRLLELKVLGYFDEKGFAEKEFDENRHPNLAKHKRHVREETTCL